MIPDFLKVGRRYINLSFLIEAVDTAHAKPSGEPDPEGMIISMMPGQKSSLSAEDAARLRNRLEELSRGHQSIESIEGQALPPNEVVRADDSPSIYPETQSGS